MSIGNPRPLFSATQLQRKIRAMGKRISEDYAGRSLHVVALSNGAIIFSADLIRAIKLPMRYDVIAASSYRGATKSSGKVSIGGEEQIELAGQDVLLVDEILDSGRTLSAVSAAILKKNPASLKICVLLDKPSRRVMPVHADYVGFEIEDLFVVGFGLDHKELYRNLPFIGIIEEN
ncbi:MAG: hypoxanthine phosphoribosyltransferase [Lentisphaerae bacterium GWF2_52_8]|nr:MAG: hypoxanthine phosphoribosyltransferase [Lentisphaerae bacterium GWF2_52_8]